MDTAQTPGENPQTNPQTPDPIKPIGITEKSYSLLITTIVVGVFIVSSIGYLTYQSIQPKKDQATSTALIKLKEESETTENRLSETHINRLFSIKYPKKWRAIINETGGLVEIKQPSDDHSVVKVKYINGQNESVENCNLLTKSQFSEVITVENLGYQKLLRYNGEDKFNLPEIGYVAIEGANGIINNCTVITFDDTWIIDENKEVAWAMIQSVQLNKAEDDQ